MIPYVLRRLLVLPVVIFLVTLILFCLMGQLLLERQATTGTSHTDRILLGNLPQTLSVLIVSDFGAMPDQQDEFAGHGGGDVAAACWRVLMKSNG